MTKHRVLPILALPPRGQRKRVLGALLGIEAVASLLLIFAHTQISQGTAKWLLAMSETAFEGSNTTILLQLIGTTFISYHVEIFVFLTILSLRTVLALRVLTTDILDQKRWPLKLIVWKNFAWFLLTVLSYYLLFCFSFAVFGIPAILFLFLFFSWPIVYAAGGVKHIFSLRLSLRNTAAGWKKLLLPWLLVLAAQIAFLLGIWNAMFSFEQVNPFYGLPLLFLCMAGAELGYLLWAKYFTQTVQILPTSTAPVFPKWMVVLTALGAVIVALWLFILTKSLVAINQDPTLRSQLVYDLLPKAETVVLDNWQKQLENQRALENMTPEQSQRLDELIDQMGIEYKNQATMSGSVQLETQGELPAED